MGARKWVASTERARNLLLMRIETMLSLIDEAGDALVRGNGVEVEARISDVEVELKAMKSKIAEDWPWDTNGRVRSGEARDYPNRLYGRTA